MRGRDGLEVLQEVKPILQYPSPIMAKIRCFSGIPNGILGFVIYWKTIMLMSHPVLMGLYLFFIQCTVPSFL